MNMIDLSQPINTQTPIYPGDAPLILKENATLKEEGFSTYLFSSNLHAGTHIEAPNHLIEDGRTIGDFPLEQFSGRGVLLNVKGQKEISYCSSYEEIVQKNDIVLLYTGHDNSYFEEVYFTEHPIVTETLAHFFVKKKIKILGMDMPSPDHYPYNIHKKLLKADILLLENLTHLELLKNIESFQVLALPLKIEAEASFVRAIAKIK